MPSSAGSYNEGGGTEILSYLCDTAPIPGRTIATSELRHYGPTRKIARESTYPEFHLSFIFRVFLLTNYYRPQIPKYKCATFRSFSFQHTFVIA